MAGRLYWYLPDGSYIPCVVTVPASVVYCATAGSNAKSVIGAVFTVFIVSIIVLMLSCVLGYLVAVIGHRLAKARVLLRYISILFIGAYYLLCIKSRTIITELNRESCLYEEKVRTSAYPCILGKGRGKLYRNPCSHCSYSASGGKIYMCMSKSFIKTATAWRL